MFTLIGLLTINNRSITAFNQVANQLVHDVDHEIFLDTYSNHIETLKYHEKTLELQHSKIQTTLSKELAIKDQMIAKLVSEKSTLESALWKSVKDIDLYKQELEDNDLQSAKLNQAIVELRLRGLGW